MDAALRTTVQQEIIRKEEEWEKTKRRLELRMEADMEKIRAGNDKNQQSNAEGEGSIANITPKSSNWTDSAEIKRKSGFTGCSC